MRVLESNSPASYTMGKKNRLRKNRRNSAGYNTESSDEGKACRHLNKSISLTCMRKNIKQLVFGECSTCIKDLTKKSNEEAALDTVVEQTLWVCLQCGHQGCDRNSHDQHALKHYHTPRSVSHAIVVNTTTWVIWCYDCDDEVDINVSKKLQESVEFLRKQGAKPDLSFPKGGQVQDCIDVAREHPTEDPTTRQADNIKRKNTIPNPALYPKVKGLNNLGNTCFFNAVLQNIGQTYELERLLSEKTKSGCQLTVSAVKELKEFMSDSSENEEDDCKPVLTPLTLTLREGGSLSQSMLKFLTDMDLSSNSNSLSPSVLFGHICKKAPRFKGFQQQDSHELLRHLLDGMKTEEIQRVQKAILNELSINPKKVDEETKTKLKEYGKQAKHTFVDSLFGGQLISSVLCEDCKRPSQIFEDFLDLSLPLVEEKGSHSRFNASSGARQKEVKFRDDKTPTTAVDDFANNVSKHKSKKAKKLEKKSKKKGVTKRQCSAEECTEEEKNEVKEDKEDNSNKHDENSNEDEISDADVEDNVECDFPMHTATEEQENEDDNTDDKVLCANGVDEDTVNGSKTTEERDSNDSYTIETLCHSTEKLELNSENHLGAIDDLTSTHNGSKEREKSASTALGEPGSTELDVSKENTKSNNGRPNTPNVKTKESNSRSQLLHELRIKAMTTLSPRYHPDEQECSVMSCLHQFTAAELLTGNNKFGCGYCTKHKNGVDGKKESVYKNASKQLLIFNPPAILTLHMKRFQQVGYSLRKVNRHVTFPVLLDISPFCSSLCQGIKPNQTKLLYALYGVVEHSGRLSAGHYMAYVKVRQNVNSCKDFLQVNHINPTVFLKYLHAESTEQTECDNKNVNPPEGRWFYVSDTRVSESSEAAVLRAQAYLLFYERII